MVQILFLIMAGNVNCIHILQRIQEVYVWLSLCMTVFRYKSWQSSTGSLGHLCPAGWPERCCFLASFTNWSDSHHVDVPWEGTKPKMSTESADIWYRNRWLKMNNNIHILLCISIFDCSEYDFCVVKAWSAFFTVDCRLINFLKDLSISLFGQYHFTSIKVVIEKLTDSIVSSADHGETAWCTVMVCTRRRDWHSCC